MAGLKAEPNAVLRGNPPGITDDNNAVASASQIDTTKSGRNGAVSRVEDAIDLMHPQSMTMAPSIKSPGSLGQRGIDTTTRRFFARPSGSSAPFAA